MTWLLARSGPLADWPRRHKCQIRPLFAVSAKATTARLISLASLTFMGLTATPNYGATAWMTPNWAIPAGSVESRRTSTEAQSA
jgi:hypothetical protein